MITSNHTGWSPSNLPQQTFPTLAIGIAIVATLAAGFWAVTPGSSHVPDDAIPGVAAFPGDSDGAIAVSKPSAIGTARLQVTVQSLMREYDQVYPEPATTFGTRSLQPRSYASEQELLAKLSALGPGGARAIAWNFKATDGLRDRTVLAQALGRIHDRETVSVLNELLLREPDPYVRQQLILALGHRSEPSVVQPLARMLTAEKPEFLQFGAVQALAGRAEALPVLQAAVQTASDHTVRLEAVRAVGSIGNEAAKRTLTDLAQEPTVEPYIREIAIQELRRSFGPSALPTLQSLIHDDEPSVRESASRALALLQIKN